MVCIFHIGTITEENTFKLLKIIIIKRQDTKIQILKRHDYYLKIASLHFPLCRFLWWRIMQAPYSCLSSLSSSSAINSRPFSN